MIFVTKFDGRRQPFDRRKVINTCLKLHATQKHAKTVADKIERNAYDGIPTHKILRMIFTYLHEFRPELSERIDLKEAISRLRPKPDFEQFVDLLLKEYGYSVEGNQLVKGKCVTHEIDAIATKGNDVIFVEAKHHLQSHTYTGVDICLETQARLEDLREGFVQGKNRINFAKALIVCNTKFSDHALQYAQCKGIKYLGWKAPYDSGLEKIIERKKLYPITLLKKLDSKTEQIFGDNGIVTLKQLLQYDVELLQRKTKIQMNKLRSLIKDARSIISA